MDLSRPLAPEPYSLLPATGSFVLTSTDISDGAALPSRFSVDGENISPQLSWHGFPSATRSFVLSCFDPDAPTPAGYWHWTVANLPAAITELPTGTGAPGAADLPAGAIQVRTDGGTVGFEGAAPPPGDRPHRYIFAVHALDVDALPVTADNTPTVVAFQALFHTIARATLTATYQR